MIRLSNKKWVGEDVPLLPATLGYDKEQEAITVEYYGKDGGLITNYYRTLSELNKDWKDYDEEAVEDAKWHKKISW